MGSTPAVLNKINNIEMIQRRAARWVKQDYRLTSSVSDMINTYNGPLFRNVQCIVD